MHTLSVTIGRNVTNIGVTLPMDGHVWQKFKNRTHAIVRALGQTETFNGQGEWDGVVEDSAMFSTRQEEPYSDSQIAALRDALKLLAYAFAQDAIALTIGESELIKP